LHVHSRIRIFRMTKKTKSRRKTKTRNQRVNELKLPSNVLLDRFRVLLDTAEYKRSMNKVDISDLRTIDLDVQRSVAHWNVHRHLSPTQRNSIRSALRDTVHNVVSSYPGFRYYQGIHEVCLVVLHATNVDVILSTSICRVLLLTHFKSLVLHDFTISLTPLLEGLRYLVEATDPELSRILESSGVGYHFSVPWILTWFAHSINDFSTICIIYTHLLNRKDQLNYLSCLYLCCAVIAQQRESIIRNRGDSCCVFRSLQSAAQSAEWRKAIKFARIIESHHPVEEIVANCPNLAEALKLTKGRGNLNIHVGLTFGASVIGVLSYFVISRYRLDSFI